MRPWIRCGLLFGVNLPDSLGTGSSPIAKSCPANPTPALAITSLQANRSATDNSASTFPSTSRSTNPIMDRRVHSLEQCLSGTSKRGSKRVHRSPHSSMSCSASMPSRSLGVTWKTNYSLSTKWRTGSACPSGSFAAWSQNAASHSRRSAATSDSTLTMSNSSSKRDASPHLPTNDRRRRRQTTPR